MKTRFAHRDLPLKSLNPLRTAIRPATFRLLCKLPVVFVGFVSLILATVVSYAGDSDVAALDDLTVLAGQLADLSTDPAYGEYLASACLTCHRPVAGGEIPLLHGRDRVDLILALLQYKHSIRANTTMQSIAAVLSNEEIATLAQFFSTLDAQ